MKNKIISLLKSDAVVEIERKIAEHKKCMIYKNDLPMLAGFMVDEINQSELSIEELSSFIINNKAEITAFAISFLDGQSPKSLSAGIAITYAIYLLYLEQKGDEMLELYIIRRQIPNAKKFCLQLKKAKEAVK
jgi:DNA-binding transcriptional ArsR family regulator